MTHPSHPFTQGLRLTLAVLLTSALNLPAVMAGDEGTYIETLNRTAGLTGEAPTEELSKTYLAHDRMKVVGTDPQGTDMILDPANGTMTFLNHAAKEYYQINVKDMMAGMSQPGMEQMRAMMEETRISVTETGQTKKIGDWTCQEYKVTKTGMMGIDQEICATEDVAVDVNRFTEMMSLSGPDGLLGDSPAAAAQRAEMAKIKGYPILTKTRMQMMGTTMESESEVKVIRQEAMPLSLFEIPEGYQQKEMAAPAGMSEAPSEPAQETIAPTGASETTPEPAPANKDK